MILSFPSEPAQDQALTAQLDTRTLIRSSMASADVFMDSSGFLALWDASDVHHCAAVRLQKSLARRKRRFVTTDYVADETATLPLARHRHAAASDFLSTLGDSRPLRLEWMDADRFHDASNFFQKHHDKTWSFTDCFSFILMREQRILEAFTSDHHFGQAGFVALLGR